MPFSYRVCLRKVVTQTMYHPFYPDKNHGFQVSTQRKAYFSHVCCFFFFNIFSCLCVWCVFMCLYVFAHVWDAYTCRGLKSIWGIIFVDYSSILLFGWGLSIKPRPGRLLVPVIFVFSGRLEAQGGHPQYSTFM